jgi:uroporphyrinogen decarboxylase
MTSRERVLTAFAHEEPDRVPAWCGASEEFWTKAKRELDLDDEGLRLRFGDDFRRVFAKLSESEKPFPTSVTSRTPFGVERIGLGWGQPTSHPLTGAKVDDVHDFAWPNPLRMEVSHIREEAAIYKEKYAILGGDWSPYWHDLIDLLGMETMFMKMYEEPALVDAVLDHVVDYYAAVSQNIFDAAGDAIDIFFIGNDFGSQKGPLLSEAMFRRFLLPHLARLVDLGHGYGLKVMLHCCGGFRELIPAMIEVGLDGLHALQPSCTDMDPRRLKQEFGDKILLNGAIDSHHVLINGTPDFVREKTRDTLDIMKPGGGYVAGASHDTILEETPLENVVSMFDAIQEYGAYGYASRQQAPSLEGHPNENE